MIFKRRIAVACICCVFGAGTVTAAAAPIDDGVEAYLRGNYKQALRIWEPLAAKGNAAAQYWLGSMYFNGQGGIPQNHQEAMKLCRLAALQGHMDAQFVLGHMYADGEGVEQDYHEAAKWFRAAAEQGHEGAKKALRDPRMIEAAKSLDATQVQSN